MTSNMATAEPKLGLLLYPTETETERPSKAFICTATRCRIQRPNYDKFTFKGNTGAWKESIELTERDDG